VTSKERVLTAIDHRQPDRAPIQVYLTPEIDRKLRDHFASDDLLGILGVDFRGVGPKRVAPLPPMPARCDHVDEWGTGYKNIQFETGTYAEAEVLPLAQLETMDDVDAYVDAARALGIHAIRFESHARLEPELESLGIREDDG